MSKFILTVAGAIATAAAASLVLIFAIAAATLGGAVSGWVVGYFFPGSLDLLSQKVFGQVLPHWQLGAILGFLGSFFRSSLSTDGDKKTR